MGILVEFWRDMRRWEKSTQWAFGIAFVVLVVLLLIMVIGKERVPSTALIGLIGLATMLQAIAMWGNRHLVTAYTRAQSLFRDGDFEGCMMLLQQHIADQLNAQKPVQVQVYILLGNALRNIGDLAQSERILLKAVNAHPDDPFAMYGLGKTQLVQGRYEESYTSIKKSLSLGAPYVVNFDLGYASDAAQINEPKILRDVLPELREPHRVMMATFLLYQQGMGEFPLATQIEAGLPFWEREVTLHAQTAYGQHVREQLNEIKRH